MANDMSTDVEPAWLSDLVATREVSMAEEYVPTLGEYAAVLGWLWDEVLTPDEQQNVHEVIPDEMRAAFNDALQRASLRRFTRTMAHVTGRGSEERLDAIEARQRADLSHDPDCPLRSRNESQRHTTMYLHPPECTCWLAQPEGEDDA